MFNYMCIYTYNLILHIDCKKKPQKQIFLTTKYVFPV